ncbi:hypothetical protein MtrunA17_Chr1g0196041 [Medicago truncatula]|uniref:Uncharacterized protein n=1 Tax=Medicago truncatula TaxID=3880 RepID=A0A396JS74_MEDTR|nr:hypothetical protein MtrunA17_Chr1g0196041 [Medicago truncatula]
MFNSIHINGEVVKTINQLNVANHPPQFLCLLDVEEVGDEGMSKKPIISNG